MATRVSRAIDELAAALGGRPFVLVIDPVHEEVTDRSGLHVFWSQDAPYVHRGLLIEADEALREHKMENRDQARYGTRKPPEEDPDAPRPRAP